MEEIVTLIQEIERKLRTKRIFLRRNIFSEIIRFLQEYQTLLYRNLKPRPSISKQVKFALQQIVMQLDNSSQLESSAEIYVLIQSFLQLLTPIHGLFEQKEQQRINIYVQELKNFSVFILSSSDRKLTDVRSALAKEIDERKKIQRKYNVQFEHAQQQLQETQNLLATTSADILIQNYEETAFEEKQRARYHFCWGISTIFVGILAVSLLFADCFRELTRSLSWEHFLFKASIFIMFLIPAIYMLKESAKREEHYFKLTDLSLKIRTIPNYVKDIPEVPVEKLSEKDKVRLELAKVIFGYNITAPVSKVNDETIEELINLLRLAMKGK